jgi:hypothetical protein
MYRDDRSGCLTGLLQLFLLDRLFNWLQRSFGFGRGGVIGCGCGPLLLIIILCLATMIVCNTNWPKLFALAG